MHREGKREASRKEHTAAVALQRGQASLTFRRCELNVILLAEGGWEDGVGGGMVTEPVRAVCRGPPIHTDHQVAVQENLRAVEQRWGRQRTWYHEQGGCGGDTRPWIQPELDISFPELLQSSRQSRTLCWWED